MKKHYLPLYNVNNWESKYNSTEKDLTYQNRVCICPCMMSELISFTAPRPMNDRVPRDNRQTNFNRARSGGRPNNWQSGGNGYGQGGWNGQQNSWGSSNQSWSSNYQQQGNWNGNGQNQWKYGGGSNQGYNQQGYGQNWNNYYGQYPQNWSGQVSSFIEIM